MRVWTVVSSSWGWSSPLVFLIILLFIIFFFNLFLFLLPGITPFFIIFSIIFFFFLSLIFAYFFSLVFFIWFFYLFFAIRLFFAIPLSFFTISFLNLLLNRLNQLNSKSINCLIFLCQSLNNFLIFFIC